MSRTLSVALVPTVSYRQDQPDGQVQIRNKHGELVGWTAFGQTRSKDGTVVSLQQDVGLLYRDLK